MMKLDDRSVQTIGTAIILALSQSMPAWIGHPVASAISWVMSNRFVDPMYRAVYENQRVVHDGKLSHQEIRRIVRRVYQNQGRALYDFYHYLDRPEKVNELVKISPKFENLMKEHIEKKNTQGTMLLMPHLSGFNLGGLRLGRTDFKFLTLAVPNPNRGYTWQNKLRNDRGMEVVPMSVSNLHEARKRLENGGVVLTGVDRPHEESTYQPLFFGKPANLPVAYIRLALNTAARVFVVGFKTLLDHTCEVEVSDQIKLENRPDPHEELIFNAQKVLKIAEQFIQLDPSQWMMFLPVWTRSERDIVIS